MATISLPITELDRRFKEIDGKYLHPAWSPPSEVKRDKPDMPDVIPGGSPRNPMGVAAMTLAGGEYAIHGTNVPGSVGGFVSYGCIRMYNADVSDLFDRVLSRHRHPQAVHGFVLKGRWRYLEHDWEATEGSYVFEPPGEVHTLTVPADCPEMITLFNISGAMIPPWTRSGCAGWKRPARTPSPMIAPSAPSTSRT